MGPHPPHTYDTTQGTSTPCSPRADAILALLCTGEPSHAGCLRDPLAMLQSGGRRARTHVLHLIAANLQASLLGQLPLECAVRVVQRAPAVEQHGDAGTHQQVAAPQDPPETHEAGGFLHEQPGMVCD